MGLSDDLRPGPTALDTAVFIYFIEEDPDRGSPGCDEENHDHGRPHGRVRVSDSSAGLCIALATKPSLRLVCKRQQ